MPTTEPTSPGHETPAARARLVHEAARRLGFELVGIAPAEPLATYPQFRDWLDQGYAGEMHYLPRRATAYEHPRHVLPEVRSVVVVGLNYHVPSQTGTALTTDSPTTAEATIRGRIAMYARGPNDYHDVLKTRLQELASVLHANVPGCRTRCVVDTAPLLERDLARRAGLGWFGKNTMLIAKRQGSYFFLGALLTDVELTPDGPHETSHCGTCTRCLEVCPTDAFPAPGVLDARRCLSYLTIELKGPIPLDLRPGLGDWLFGCDLCQDVCPWNRKAPITHEPAFQPRPADRLSDLAAVLTVDDATLGSWLEGTPLSRPGPVGIKRNAAIVAGNLGDPALLPALAVAAEHASPVVRGAAVWALSGFESPTARTILEQRRLVESDPTVLAELDAASKTIARRTESRDPC
jgi:epoxyqueuosine reductase